MINRCEKNPLIIKDNVKPSRQDFKVDGVFNAGAIKVGNETILLLRVAESVICEDSRVVKIPVVNRENFEIEILEFDLNNSEYDFSDSRVIKKKGSDKTEFLTSLSHIRIARSQDGINFEVGDTPFISPTTKYETWGVEDPRVIEIDGMYYINYTSVSAHGASTSLVKTKDFINVEHLGVILLAENKDVCLFPEKINGKYYALTRPVPKAFGNPEIFLSESQDLTYWGNHKYVVGLSDNKSWDDGRIGGGAPVIKTDKGWLEIYHAADKDDRYCLGAMLLDLENPEKIIAKSKTALMEPEEIYEKEGFFGNVVFTCGVILEGDILNIYYGAADDKIALAKISLSDIYKHLEV